MELVKTAASLAAKIRELTNDVSARHIGRGDVVRATLLALVSGRPAFFLGPPGVDKTGTLECLASRIEDAKFFDALMPTVVSVEQLLVESTSIEEVPTADGGRQIRTRDALGRAALAHIFLADELWKADARLLQTVLDLAKGDGVRHEGALVKTPLLAFLSASNELPDPEGNLGAVWSRMTIRVVVNALDRAGKTTLVESRLTRDRTAREGTPVRLTLDEIGALRRARPYVEVPDNIVEAVLDIYQGLLDDNSADFQWAWDDDRRFGRVFDVLQANALLDGRSAVSKSDLAVLEWLLWDTPEQISAVKAKVAPYCRTPLSDAQEVVDTLLSPSGTVEAVCRGDRLKVVQAVQQCETALEELAKARDAATDAAMQAAIEALTKEVDAKKAEVIAVLTGAKAS